MSRRSGGPIRAKHVDSRVSTQREPADEDAQVTKALLQNVPIFTDLTETQRSTISNRSIKFFTLSGIYNATQTLLAAHGTLDLQERFAGDVRIFRYRLP